MSYLRMLTFSALLGTSAFQLPAVAQVASTKDQLVGAWEIVSDTTTDAKGNKHPVFGERPHGFMVFSPNGYFAIVTSDPSRPKWKEAVRSKVTPEEYRTTALGLFAQSGTWSIADGGRTLVKKIASAFNPANEDKVSRLPISLKGDVLTITDPASPAAGGAAFEVFRRAN